jgi:hypothetical protein
MKDVTINKVSVIRERAEALVAKHGLTLVLEYMRAGASDEPETAMHHRFRALVSDAACANTCAVLLEAALHAARAQERERCAGILHRALDAAAIDHGEQCVGGCECYENFAEAMMGVEFAIRNPPDSENKEHDDDK